MSSYYCKTTLYGKDGIVRSFRVAFPIGYDVTRWARYWLGRGDLTAVEVSEDHE